MHPDVQGFFRRFFHPPFDLFCVAHHRLNTVRHKIALGGILTPFYALPHKFAGLRAELDCDG